MYEIIVTDTKKDCSKHYVILNIKNKKIGKFSWTLYSLNILFIGDTMFFRIHYLEYNFYT